MSENKNRHKTKTNKQTNKKSNETKQNKKNASNGNVTTIQRLGPEF